VHVFSAISFVPLERREKREERREKRGEERREFTSTFRTEIFSERNRLQLTASEFGDLVQKQQMAPKPRSQKTQNTNNNKTLTYLQVSL
jgi:hypothetical protein